jgi:hypothetical protein
MHTKITKNSLDKPTDSITLLNNSSHPYVAQRLQDQLNAMS